MTVHAPVEVDEIRLVSEIEALIAFNAWLEDRRARRMVVDRYLAGWCTAEFALETLIGLGLLEHDAGLAKARDA